MMTNYQHKITQINLAIKALTELLEKVYKSKAALREAKERVHAVQGDCLLDNPLADPAKLLIVNKIEKKRLNRMVTRQIAFICQFLRRIISTRTKFQKVQKN